jgi:3-oxoacyl-[acyl-carrier-protein] synthase-3
MAYLNYTTYYLPEATLTNEDIDREFPEWDIHKIGRKTGVLQRHIAGENEFPSDMAVTVATQLFEEYGIEKSSIDFIVLCVQNPDYIMPATACVVQDALGLNKSCGAFDFNLGCSGYVYGLGIAKGLVDGGLAQNVLLITAEVLTKYIGKTDRVNRSIIGDGATASLISAQKKGYDLLNFVFGTDGSGIKHILIKEGGIRYPEITNEYEEDEFGNKWKPSEFYMNGREVFSFVLATVPVLVEDTLTKNNLSKDDISYFVFHQANKYMLEHVRKKIEVPEERFVILMEDCGNTSSCSVPIAFKRLMAQKEIHSGEYLCLAGFGVGLSWGGVVIRKV